MNSVLVRPYQHTPTPVPSPPALQRECDRLPDLFDLPTPASADLLEGPLSPVVGTTTYVTFNDLEDEDATTARFAKQAAKAVAACKGCPFLQSCRKEAHERLSAGQRPQSEIVAAVAFNDAGLPEPAVHNTCTEQELEQHTLDADLGINATRATEYTDWVPADLEPIDLADTQAVALALDEMKTNYVVSQTYLDLNPDASADGRIVLSYADEWAVLTRGIHSGVSRHRLAQILDCSWKRSSETAFIIGLCEADENSFEPTPWDHVRRAIYRSDVDEERTQRANAAAAQRSRDRHVLQRNHIHDEVLDLATAYGVRIDKPARAIPPRLRHAAIA
ncbi:hypothetical protein [Gordonia alkanivorans]|uniref:hypothetical protein n=1 Tax=Gordonia alkanivorans TaxID=84096 RepID=UPI0004B983E4|nr:hypothetical protein [Gordonia alkanivorans]